MARHYLPAYSFGAEKIIEIPAPAVDVVTTSGIFGSSGTFISGGAYVRRTTFGAQNLEVSWNLMDSKDVARLMELAESGPFVWANPTAFHNVAPPWLANHGAVADEAGRTYMLEGPNIESAEVVNMGTTLDGYSTRAIKYVCSPNGEAELFSFVVPEGYEARVWMVGEQSQFTARPGIRFQDGSLIPHSRNPNSPPSGSRVYAGHHTLEISGSTRTEDVVLSSIQIRIIPEGTWAGDISYSPGMGATAMEFDETGLQMVRHSAALDLTGATATWKETGWWK